MPDEDAVRRKDRFMREYPHVEIAHMLTADFWQACYLENKATVVKTGHQLDELMDKLDQAFGGRQD
jgi:hypothetical protein